MGGAVAPRSTSAIATFFARYQDEFGRGPPLVWCVRPDQGLCTRNEQFRTEPRSVVYLRLKHKLDKWPQARALNTQTTEEGILMSDVLASIIVLVVTALLVFRRELTASRGAKASRREL